MLKFNGFGGLEKVAAEASVFASEHYLALHHETYSYENRRKVLDEIKIRPSLRERRVMAAGDRKGRHEWIFYDVSFSRILTKNGIDGGFDVGDGEPRGQIGGVGRDDD